MNSMVIDSVRGVNRIEAFLNNQQAALREVNPAELEAVEGGLSRLGYFLLGVAVGACLAGIGIGIAIAL